MTEWLAWATGIVVAVWVAVSAYGHAYKDGYERGRGEATYQTVEILQPFLDRIYKTEFRPALDKSYCEGFKDARDSVLVANDVHGCPVDDEDRAR